MPYFLLDRQLKLGSNSRFAKPRGCHHLESISSWINKLSHYRAELRGKESKNIPLKELEIGYKPARYQVCPVPCSAYYLPNEYHFHEMRQVKQVKYE